MDTEQIKNLENRMGLENLSRANYFPKYFEMETVRGCNARCSMCTIYEWNGRGLMSDNLFSRIVGEVKHYNDWIERVCLSRNGEPLLDKKLPERIKAIKEAGIKYVTFSTNASLLNEEKTRALISSGLDDIRFSIDGVTKKTFEEIRKGLNFEEVVENCLRFIRIRDEIGSTPTVQVRMTLQNANKHEEEEWKKYWKARISGQDIVSSKPMHSWGNQLKNYEGEEKENGVYTGIPCISLWSTMIIHFDGRVPLCGCDYNNKFTLGNINNSSIQQVWQSQQFSSVRELHSSGKRNEIELCNGCNVWDSERKVVYKE